METVVEMNGPAVGDHVTVPVLGVNYQDLIPPSLKGMNYIIFPEDKLAQIWDFIMILATFFYAFVVPYQIGISAGYNYIARTGWFAFGNLMNIILIVDTFMHFFRAYRDKNGLLIYSMKSIRKNYIRSGWFCLNLLAAFPSCALIHFQGKVDLEDGNYNPLGDTQMLIYFILDIFKLLRLVRVRQLLNTSELIQVFYEHNIVYALILKFLFMIVIASHWFACTWGFIAFLEAGSYQEEYMVLPTLTWISSWYAGSYIEGGLNPIGWGNAYERYHLCLFWAIQSITSIGYGNIAPVTTVEYACANALMLLCGIFWAYIIGGLVGAVSSMGSLHSDYVTRIIQANSMLDDFTEKDLPHEIAGTQTITKASRRVRRFLTSQRDKATKKWFDSHSAPTLSDTYPTLTILSPELKKVCALHLLHGLIEAVPYLSSRYLTPDEQSEVALNCVSLEFSSGEQFSQHPQLGRGILIFKTGFGFATRSVESGRNRWRKGRANRPFDVNEVLVEDDYYSERHLVYHFIGFTKVLFIPRTVILDILAKNKAAWKCARWRYVLASCVLRSMSGSEKPIQNVEVIQSNINSGF